DWGFLRDWTSMEKISSDTMRSEGRGAEVEGVGGERDRGMQMQNGPMVKTDPEAECERSE
ncbi:uncharacterized, partial [Tachysurus ichikawai]